MTLLAPIDALMLVPAYAYCLFPILASALRERALRSGGATEPYRPTVTVIIPVYNGAPLIKGRIQNILESRYPLDLIDILVVDDGSTDAPALPEGIGAQARLLRAGVRKGRASAHLLAHRAARGEILIFTDVDTEFSPATLPSLVDAFSDPGVSCAGGVVEWRNIERSGVAESMGLYWKFEMWLREILSARGVLAVASGACMAVRGARFPSLRNDEDIDCVAPLEVALSGERVAHVAHARASDRASETTGGDIRGRTRMVALDFPATMRRLTPNAVRGQPAAAWSVASHKLARWLAAPCLLVYLGALIGGAAGRPWLQWMGAGVVAMVVLGAAAQSTGHRLPVAGAIFSFFLAQLGVTLGMVRGIFFPAIESYDPAEVASQ